MKKLVFAVVVSSCSYSYAQVASAAEAQKIADSVIDAFNSQDIDRFLALGEKEFIAATGESSARDLVASWKESGTLSKAALILDTGEVRHYKFTVSKNGKSSDLVLSLGVNTDGKFFSLGLNGLPKPKGKPFEPKTDNPRKSAMDELVAKATSFYFQQTNPVGVSIAILKDGKAHFYNYGETAVDTGALPTKDSIYEIGSMTKAMTGTMLARAVLDKKLSLDDDIRKYLPAGFDHLQWEGTPVLIRHLSNHTSGLPSHPKSVDSNSLDDPWKPLTRKQLFEDLRTDKMVRKPGSQGAYSNLAVGVLGHIIADQYHRTYEALLRDLILLPAGMRSTAIHLTPSQEKLFVSPHNEESKPTSHWNVNGIEGAGAVRSSSADILKFSAWLMRPDNKAAQLAMTKSSDTVIVPLLDLGLCWVLRNSRTVGRTSEHSGGTGGFTTQIILSPEKRIAVVVLTNSFNSNPTGLAQDLLFLAANTNTAGTAAKPKSLFAARGVSVLAQSQ